ncbi:vitamin B12-dependent ribonucleotide reductase [Nocardiopsis listeri]|uniref:vitamin B12-dependent ribonucleotide reductase n=1 Tax=Nocardiopsis listeri TaxID=53440 RepID=UPI00082B942F|nr:vitamin B12-dependent ribonucleotide reductase [Nocardiopsis listeri]
MTETSSGSTSRKGKKGPKGLKIERVFTTEGVHPYDTLDWERRDVVMTNWRDGSVNFEQRGVEFPTTWSMNATQIVASKYFRGALGAPEREWSLKQLIDRVVGVYTETGLESGYFASEEDAEIFDHELKHALANQYFSFNSPVWFNVGTTSSKQVSACQPYDSLVSTPAGLVPIGSLVEQDAVGTKVLDAHGVTRIVATKANGVKNVLRLHTKAGHRLDVTADHWVWKSEGAALSDGRFLPAGELRPGDSLQWHRQESHGESEIRTSNIAEAALAGWLQADGFVGQYQGTNKSLTIEAITVTQDELEWVTSALDRVFPDVHRKETKVQTQDTSLDCRRTRLYGNCLKEFVGRWGLRTRGVDMVTPPELFTAPLPVVRAYLRSLFQAEGYVSDRRRSTLIGLDMISEELVRGAQQLLTRFGIFSRVRVKRDSRPDRHDLYSLNIQPLGERDLFHAEIGFIDEMKSNKLERSLEREGRAAKEHKTLQIAHIEDLGPMEVYDIQTESGEYLSGSLRVHNCFILSVDDTMESILDWYKEEGIIFKGGSGAGVNLSRIRSSKELLSSGGTASGPVSFMRGADASAGTIKSGGATRRAAKMVVLDVDHPDIEEFVETKAREEHKIRALRDAGFDVDLGGDDMFSVQYQNANNSVRVSDAFMRAVESGSEFGLTSRTTGEVVATVDAKDLFHRMARAAWECADPGIQYDGTIQDWHTNPETGRISASNPCSEYLSLDDSSCNLASINLLKFLREDDSFDVENFTRLTELVITAMDISITFADFPTEKIGETTRAYRQLGIGYTNLGALLMATGHAYDSDGGRAVAAAVTSLMTGTAYRRSAEMAGVVGAYDGYKRNERAHKRVMRKHAAANDDLRTVGTLEEPIHAAATAEWADCLKVGERNGWRNAQASLLAPTGTISFMMDSDTTGVEPDFSLVKYKKLVGGGSMRIVNQAIPRALGNLGYQAEQSEAIVEFVAENGHVVDAPSLRSEHYEVFDCAMGHRYIEPMGHVRMMASVQPFLSGAISKTVNVPEGATVADFEHIYYEGWRLGLKALAVYRDNCKVGQPLSTGKSEEKAAPEKVEVAQTPRPVRRRLPKKRPSETTSFSVGGAEGYITAGSYPDDGLGEVFLKLGKQGSTLAGVMDAFSIAISIALQYGVPLETYVEKFTNMRFDPAGMTDDPDIRMAQSVVDYIFRRLALDHLPYEERAALGVLSASEREAQLNGEDPTQVATQVESYAQSAAPSNRTEEPAETSAAPRPDSGGFMADAPLCIICGTKMRPSGSCYACEGCGATSGCS